MKAIITHQAMSCGCNTMLYLYWNLSRTVTLLHLLLLLTEAAWSSLTSSTPNSAPVSCVRQDRNNDAQFLKKKKKKKTCSLTASVPENLPALKQALLVSWVSTSCRNDTFSVGCGADREGRRRGQQIPVSAHLCGPLCGTWQHLEVSFPVPKPWRRSSLLWHSLRAKTHLVNFDYWLSFQHWAPTVPTRHLKSLETHKPLCSCTNSPEASQAGTRGVI